MKKHKSAGIQNNKCGFIYNKEFYFNAGLPGRVKNVQN